MQSTLNIKTNKLKQRLLWGAGIFLFIAMHLYYLDKYPVVWIDDVFVSESALNILKVGKLISHLFAPITKDYDPDKGVTIAGQIPHYLHALIYWIFGMGTFQARLVSFLSSLLSILVTYFLAKTLFNKKVGILSCLLWAFSHVFFIHSHQARPEIMVGLMNLLSVLFFYQATEKKSQWLFFLSGITAALNIDVHIPGAMAVFMIFGLLILYFKTLEKRQIFLVLGGLGIGGLWWIGTHILPDVNLFFNQWNLYFKGVEGPPLEGNSNIFLQELYRYYSFFWKGKYHRNMIYLLLLLIAFIHSLVYRNKGQRVLITICLSGLAFNILFVPNKGTYYIAYVFSFWAILMANFIIHWLEESNALKKSIAIFFLIAIGLLNTGETSYKLWKFRNASYQQFTDKVKQYIPEGSSVCSAVSYWYAFKDHYRLINNWVAVYAFYYPEPAQLRKKIEEIIQDFRKQKIDYFIVSKDELFFAGPHPLTEKIFFDFLSQDYRLIATVDDEFYGGMYYGFPHRSIFKTDIYKLKDK